MFGISPLGWVHTLGSLPAIPAAVYMFANHRRIVPRSKAGTVYFIAMLVGAISVIPIAHEPVSYVIAGVTLLGLLLGYGVGRSPAGQGGARKYVETISLTFQRISSQIATHTDRDSATGSQRSSASDGPEITDSHSGAFQGSLFVLSIIGLTAQIVHLRKQGRQSRSL